MQGNGFEHELKHKLARLPQHNKMPELTKQRILQTIQLEENKLKRERNWVPLRAKVKWATLTITAGLILVIGGLSLKNQIISPEIGVTQGAHQTANPLAKINATDVRSIGVTDGKNGNKQTISDPNRKKAIIQTLTEAHPKQIKTEDIKGYLYSFEFQLPDGTKSVTFLGDKIKVDKEYYSLDYDVTDEIQSIIQANSKAETTVDQSTKTTPTTTDIAMTKVANFKMFNNGYGWLQSDAGLAFTNDNGATWKTITPNIRSNSSEMVMPKMFVKGQKAWFAFYSGDKAFVYRTNDGGNHWSKTSFSTEQQMMGVNWIQFLDDTHGSMLLGGDEATGNEMISIYKTSDGGETWSLSGETTPGKPSGIPYSGMKSGLYFKNSEIGWLTGVDHGDQPYLYQTTDSGKTWKHQDIAIPNGYTAEGGSSMTYSPIFFNQNDGILPVRFGGELHPYVFYTTQDGGATWKPTNDSIHAAQGIFDMNDWNFVSQKVGYATSGKQLFVTKDGGNHWSTITLNRELAKVHFQNENVGFAMSNNQLLKTVDGGKTWNTVTTFK